MLRNPLNQAGIWKARERKYYRWRIMLKKNEKSESPREKFEMGICFFTFFTEIKGIQTEKLPLSPSGIWIQLKNQTRGFCGLVFLGLFIFFLGFSFCLFASGIQIHSRSLSECPIREREKREYTSQIYG